MGKNSEVRKQAAALAAAKASALVVMKAAAKEAAEQGDVAKARWLHQEVATWKLAAQERARLAGVSHNRYGPLATPIFQSGLSVLPDDPDVGGLM